MSPAELKQRVNSRNTETHFFCRENMRFAGDTMRNYGVRSATISTHSDPTPIEVWELYRKRPVKHGLRDSAFFRKDTLTQTFPK